MTQRAHTIDVRADQCYVAVAPRPPGRISHRVAAYAVEGQLPRPIEELCLAWRVQDGQLVVVAVDQELAHAWLAGGVLSARVRTAPEGVGIGTGPLELLGRRDLPARIRTHRRWRVAALAAIVAAGCLAVAYGVHGKTIAMTRQARGADAQTIELARGALTQWRDGMSPQLALTGELRRLRAMAQGDRDDQPAESRWALAALFEAWPAGEAFRVESIDSAGGRLTLRALAPSRDAAIALATSLSGSERFEAGLPRVQSEPQRGGEVTRLELVLTHLGGGR